MLIIRIFLVNTENRVLPLWDEFYISDNWNATDWKSSLQNKRLGKLYLEIENAPGRDGIPVAFFFVEFWNLLSSILKNFFTNS